MKINTEPLGSMLSNVETLKGLKWEYAVKNVQNLRNALYIVESVLYTAEKLSEQIQNQIQELKDLESCPSCDQAIDEATNPVVVENVSCQSCHDPTPF